MNAGTDNRSTNGPAPGTGAFAVATALLVPVSVTVAVLRNGTGQFSTKVPMADAALACAIAAWLAAWIRRRAPRRSPPGTVPIVVFGGVSVLSVLGAGITAVALRELAQLLVRFVGGFLVLYGGLRSIGRLRRIAAVIAVTACAVVAYGLVQYAVVGGRHYLVSSAFDNRNVLGGYLALVLPLVFGSVLYGATRAGTLIGWGLVVSGLLVVTSVTSFLSLLAGFAVMSLFARGAVRNLVSTAVLFAVVAALPLGVRIGDLSRLPRSIVEPRSLASYHDRVARSISMFYEPPVGSVRLGSTEVVIGSTMVTGRTVPDDFLKRQLAVRSKDQSFGGGGHLHQRLLEWRAGLGVLREEPLFGVGVGNYQREIGRFYGTTPKLNTMEPDSQCGYVVTLFTSGLAGLAAFAWILLDAAGRAVRNARTAESGFAAGLSVGTVGSIVAFSVNNLFSPLIYQSTGVQFVILLAVVAASESVIAGEGGPPAAVP